MGRSVLFFKKKSKCPNCNFILADKPVRKQKCPQCDNYILVRNGELVTEEEANILDWLLRLEHFGVSRRDFDKHRKELSQQFGQLADVNDTVWRILNHLIEVKYKDFVAQEQIYREMAAFVSNEGKDPTEYLIQAEKVKEKHHQRKRQSKPRKQKQIFLGHDELAYARKLRTEGKLDKAEQFLKQAQPSPAVLDELRKIASVRAKAAKKKEDWKAVVGHLENYTAYAQQSRQYCIEQVRQEPPTHTKSDVKLLEEAKEKLAS